MLNKQLFFSHTWQNDKLDRDNHKRVYELTKNLENHGWSVWIDENDMIGNIDASIVSGIDNADAIIICLTENYCLKINDAAKDPRKRDNCLKEWTYANARNKLMIPIIMEPCLKNIEKWPPGVVSLYFGSTLYINCSDDNLNTNSRKLNKILHQYKLIPNSIKNSNNFTKKTFLNYILYQNKLSEKNKNKIKEKRNSTPSLITNKSINLQFIHKKWKSTSDLKEIHL